MDEFLKSCFSWPALPFTVLLAGVVLYWLLVILGVFVADVLDIDIDVDADMQSSLADWGMMGVRWFNLGDVPLMVWMTVLALSSWLITLYFDRNPANPTTQETAVIVARNLGLGLLAAKILTHPLKGKLKHKEPHTVAEMIGRGCVITTSAATPEFGNADCPVEDGAPLKLHVRSLSGSIPRGTHVVIVEYAPETGVYYVKPVDD